ncbi:MAG: xylulokinase, partial [Clostridia bacterium]|nr:xylulokinase [Clostridia bacterium]
MLYIGLDLGTSGIKGLLVDNSGKILKEANATYEVYYPHNGWSEQNPEDWLEAANKILGELSCGVEKDIKGVSIGGQMHGLVILDENDNVIRPAILWNDGRTSKQTDYLNNVVGK